MTALRAVDIPSIEIDWNNQQLDVWQDYLSRIEQSNIIQTWGYAQAIRAAQQQSTRFGLIKFNGVAKGIVQIQEISLFKLVHMVFMDRGPLWFEKVSEEEVESFFLEFNRLFPKRFGRKRRIMPELLLTKANEALMQRCGYTKTASGYKSVWLDLRPTEEDIRKSLKQKWRNMLNKSERLNLKLNVDIHGSHLTWLFKNYARDRLEKRYFGPSVSLLDKLCKFFPRKNVMHLRAQIGGHAVASVLIFIHGKSATYQIGWIDEIGKQKAAHNFLLWHAMVLLKKRGVEYLDLGGINDETAQGVTNFKQKMGGQPFELVGIYS